MKGVEEMNEVVVCAMIPSPDWDHDRGLFSLSFMQDDGGVVFYKKGEINQRPDFRDIPHFDEMRPALDWMAENMANACELSTKALPNSVLNRIKKRVPTRQKVMATEPPEKD